MIGFKATNSTQQVFTSDNYQKVNFDTLSYNTSHFIDSAWIPVTDSTQLVHISGQVWIIGGASQVPNPSFVIKVIKNGSQQVINGQTTFKGIDCFTGIGCPHPFMPGTVAIPFSGDDLANPGDKYNLIIYATASKTQLPFPSTQLNTVLVDNNPYHTFWYGHIV